MIVKDKQVEVETTVTGRKAGMSIRAEDMGQVMALLAGAYSDKLLAMIREYSTNARDAHIMAGTQRPIEVTLPNALAPFLKVKDYGTGLDWDEVEAVYSQYGRSTKRDSNDFNGALGIGCKSALAYCSAFTVTSIKDGNKIVVEVRREEDNSGTMTEVSSSATDEPNGTEVTIPINRSDVGLMPAKAAGLFRYWNLGTVLVNGQQPERFTAKKLTDDLWIEESLRQSVVVQAGVAYPAPQLDDLVPGYSNLVAFVPTGSVLFPPSREALQDCKQTRDTLDKVRADFEAAITKVVQNEVNAAKTPAAAIQAVLSWSPYIKGGVKTSSFKFQGRDMPGAYEAKQVGTTTNYQGAAVPVYETILVSPLGGYHAMGYASETRQVPVTDWPGTVWVHGFIPSKFTAEHKRKIAKWVENTHGTKPKLDKYSRPQAGEVQQFVMLPGGKPESDFIDPKMVVSWDEVKKINLPPRTTGIGGRVHVPGSYQAYTEKGYDGHLTGDAIRQDKPIMYINGNQHAGRRYKDAIIASESYPEFTLVCLPANRIDKFKRILPQTVTATAALRAAGDKWAKTLTRDQRLALTMYDDGVKHELIGLDPAGVNDPDLKKMIRVAKIDTKKLIDQRTKFQRYINIGSIANEKYTNPLENYPLFDSDHLRSEKSKQHTYLYLNAAFAAATA